MCAVKSVIINVMRTVKNTLSCTPTKLNSWRVNNFACKIAEFSGLNLEMLSNACRPYYFVTAENRFPAFRCPTVIFNGT